MKLHFLRLSGFKSGFTLIETIIVVGVLSGIVLVISFFALDVSKSEIFLSESLESESKLQAVAKIIVTEIRSIALSSNGSYPIATATSSSFTFYSDVDLDGYTDKVRYFLDDTVLKRGIIKSTGTPPVYNPFDENIFEVLDNVRSADIFSYYDDSYDGNQAPLIYPIDPGIIRVVGIKLVTDKNLAALPGESKVSVIANIRNLRGI